MNYVTTKEDIKKFEKSIKKLATKSELKRVEKNPSGDILRVERVENIEGLGEHYLR